MNTTARSPVARLSVIAEVFFLAGTATLSHAQDFQFRINAADPVPDIFFQTPPTIGMVRAGSGQGGNSTDAMVFSWSGEGLEAVPLPVCFEVCDGFEDLEIFGSGTHFAIERLFLRRFDPSGVPIDTADIILSQTTPSPNETHGGFFTPSLAVCPLHGDTRRSNPFQLAWWEMWQFNFLQQGPCGTINCANQPVASWGLGWDSFLSPAPSTGSTAFGLPAHCHAHRPSSAFANLTSRLVAWRDIDGPCRRILASLDGAVATVVVRDPPPGFWVDRPCADAIPGGLGYVVSWREDNLTTNQSSIYARRVASNGVLGAVMLVEGPIGPLGVSSLAGPAVCVFPDSSFAVQWIGNNGVLNPLLIKRFSNQEPPAAIGSVIEVEPTLTGTNHTIACLGVGVAQAANPTIHLASAYQFRFSDSSPYNIFARALDSATGQVGDRTLVPINIETAVDNLLGEPHQHTALLRSDQRFAVAWHRNSDNHNYCTVRTLTLGCGNGCDSIDFNNDGVSPDSVDIDDFLSVFGGGPCSNDPFCNDIDFNNDCVSPDTLDIEKFLEIFGGGSC